MLDVERPKLPIPLNNYWQLIQNKKSPYYDIIVHIIHDMEHHHQKAGGSEVIYAINPRLLQDQIEEKIKNEKLTTVNVCRTILAFLRGSRLRKEDDFYVTTTSRGRRNYHIKVNNLTLNLLHRLV